ncbi:MAG: hypothetical protein ABII27_09090 [bacterium]
MEPILTKRITLIKTGCWQDINAESLSCEISVSILSKLRNQKYTEYAKADNEERNDTACDLTFSWDKQKFAMEHTSISAYKRQHEDQAYLNRAHTLKEKPQRLKARLIKQFPKGQGGLFTIDDEALINGTSYFQQKYGEKVKKLSTYNNFVKILVIQTIDISNLCAFDFYQTMKVHKERLDYVFYVDSGQKDPQYWVQPMPVSCWETKSENILFYQYFNENHSFEYASSICINGE